MTGRGPRILFLGQKPLGEAAWARLRTAEGLCVAAVSTNVAASAGWWGTNHVAETCKAPVVDSAERRTDALLDVIDRTGVDWILCVQYPWILPPAVLERVGYRAINVHCARLPSYRGYNSFTHALLNGDGDYACMAHWMADAVDDGDVAFEGTFAIDADDTAATLWAKSHHVSLALFERVLEYLGEGKDAPRRALAGVPRFYGRRSLDGLREIQCLDDDREAALKARAFFFPPFEPAYVHRQGRKLHVMPPTAHGYLARGLVFGRAILDAMIAEHETWRGFEVSP